jgi:hypothetical protein
VGPCDDAAVLEHIKNAIADGLLAPHRVRKRPDKPHDGTITTEAVNVL